MTGLSEETRVFSKALFNLGKERAKLLEYGEEFETLIGLFREHPSFRSLFFAPRISREEKKGVVERVLSQSFSKGFTSFLKVVVVKRRQGLLEKIQKDFQSLIDADQNISRANVISAVPLDKDTLLDIERVLSKRFSKKIILNKVKVNASILGGLILEVDDVRIDLSVIYNLERLKDKILAIKLGGAI